MKRLRESNQAFQVSIFIIRFIIILEQDKSDYGKEKLKEASEE